MEYLEKTQSWKEEEFDIVLQFMRTVLLRREFTVHLHMLDSTSLTRSRWRILNLHHPLRSVTTPDSHPL